jgi:hypothetical protein
LEKNSKHISIYDQHQSYEKCAELSHMTTLKKECAEFGVDDLQTNEIERNNILEENRQFVDDRNKEMDQ